MDDRGPVSEYEVVWNNGHIDHVKAHQVSWTGRPSFIEQAPIGPPMIHFHAEVDGRWQLMLSAPDVEIAIIRNVTHVKDTPSSMGDTNE